MTTKFNVKEILEKILVNKVKISLVNVEPEFIHLDKLKDGTWRLTITKSLLEG